MVQRYTKEELQKFLIEKAEAAREPALARKIVTSMDMRGRSTAIIGRMYFFKYDPKGKEYLPKYDRFPLVIPLERYSNGFFGMNLHYVGGGARLAIIGELMKYANNELYDKSTKLDINYDLVKSLNKIESATRPCYKRYLFNHVKSRFIEFYADEYEKAIQLPVELWHFKQ